MPPLASERLEQEAAHRTQASGVEVTSEGAARALVYAGLGLAPDGLAEGAALSPPVRELVEAARAALETAKGLPLDAESKRRFSALHAATSVLEKGAGQ